MKVYERKAIEEFGLVRNAILLVCAFCSGIYFLYQYNITIPLILKVPLLMLLVVLFLKYQEKEKVRKNALQGANAERDVIQDLDYLIEQGWELLSNEDITYGDIDFILRSPQRKHFIIDVKSHGGMKFVKDGVLYRQYGKKVFPFADKCPFKGLNKQAVLFKKKYPDYETGFITTILCFTEGIIAKKSEAPPHYSRMVESRNLIPLLLSLEKNSYFT